jgi:hypothetical protein
MARVLRTLISPQRGQWSTQTPLLASQQAQLQDGGLHIRAATSANHLSGEGRGDRWTRRWKGGSGPRQRLAQIILPDRTGSRVLADEGLPQAEGSGRLLGLTQDPRSVPVQASVCRDPYRWGTTEKDPRRLPPPPDGPACAGWDQTQLKPGVGTKTLLLYGIQHKSTRVVSSIDKIGFLINAWILQYQCVDL